MEFYLCSSFSSAAAHGLSQHLIIELQERCFLSLYIIQTEKEEFRDKTNPIL